MKTPPTTDLAWKPRLSPDVVEYQSVNGIRSGVWSRDAGGGSTKVAKSAGVSVSVAVQTIRVRRSAVDQIEKQGWWVTSGTAGGRNARWA